jgi:hypothetical protein
MSTAVKSQGQAMYVATKDDRPWPLNVQRKLYARSNEATPAFASTSMESPVRNERRTPGSVRGARKPARGQPG